MAELKTKPTKDSVKDFIAKIPDEQRRKDCQVVAKLMSEVTGAKPELWSTNIVGFGRYRYKYSTGREGEWMLTGFSPRKTDLTLYLMGGMHNSPELLQRLGKHKTGKGCLYIKKLEDLDLAVLRELVEKTVAGLSATRTDK